MSQEHLENVDKDPWVVCEQRGTRGFCRLSCAAKWSYRPEFNDCEMLDQESMLKKSYGVKQAEHRRISEDSFSKVTPRRLSRTSAQLLR